MKVKVTQEHIDKATEIIKDIEGYFGYSCYCPVAMALRDTFKVEFVKASYHYLCIGSFPDPIIFEVYTPSEIVDKMRKFDVDKEMEPFEFELSLKGVKL